MFHIRNPSPVYVMFNVYILILWRESGNLPDSFNSVTAYTWYATNITEKVMWKHVKIVAVRALNLSPPGRILFYFEFSTV